MANWIGDTLIEKVYLDQKAMQKRERAIVSELQTYVQENRISSRDTDAVARWSMSKSDTYVMLYRNQRLAFEAGWWGVDDVDETDTPAAPVQFCGRLPDLLHRRPMQAVVYDFSESRLIYADDDRERAHRVLCAFAIVLSISFKTSNFFKSQVGAIKSSFLGSPVMR